MNPPAPAAVKICPECGADCAAASTSCWMCHADVSQLETFVQAEVVAHPGSARSPHAVSEWFFATSTFLLLGVAVLVGIGLALEEPGLGIVYAIVASPALIATVIRVQRRKRESGRVTWGERFATLVVSGALTVGVLSLLIAACLVALLLFCLTSMQ